MRTIALTKPFGPLDAAELADTLARIGADGADLLVRDGQSVTPSDPAGILAVARGLDRNGLVLDVVTTDLVRADATAERVIAHCAEAGAARMRVGFYRYHADLGYRRCLDRARRDLEGLARLSAGYGVTALVQLHHGTIHPSAAHAMALAHDMDGVHFYADPGNQEKEGSEDWRLCLDVLAGRVACVGVKNAARRPTPEGPRCDWVPLADGAGVLAWPAILAELDARAYAGPLSLHVHYPVGEPAAAVGADLAALRGLRSRGRA